MAETTTVSDAVLARLEALTARQEALEAEVERLSVENARLTASQPSSVSLADEARGSTARTSAAQQQGSRWPARPGVLKRRGLLAGTAVLLGAGLAKFGTVERTQAAHDGSADQTAMHVDVFNTASTRTAVLVNQATLPSFAGVNRSSSFEGVTGVGDGVQGTTDKGTANAAGVRGINQAQVGGVGVMGETNGPTGIGVFGVVGPGIPTQFPPAGSGAGVFGQGASDAVGVRGEVGTLLQNTGSGVVGVAGGCEFANASDVGVGGSGRGVFGSPANKTGVLGTTDGGVGVQGFAMAGGIGVRGSANEGGGPDFNGNGTGVEGRSGSGTGVRGESTSSIGVHGKSTSNAGVFAQGPIGVYAAGTGVAGVFGGSSGGFGFWGNSATSAGIYGTSTNGPGVRAESTNAFGLHAKSPTYAGVFEGNVFVTGRVIAQGGFGASATATTTMRTLAEDVGEATLTNGKATVALSQEFAEEVKGGRYQVFVTPHDASGRPLAVVARRRDGFDVQELAGGAIDAGTAPGRGGNAGFSYRVVTRLDGPAGPRQAPLAPPDLTTIEPAPPLPEPPKAPEPGASDERRRP